MSAAAQPRFPKTEQLQPRSGRKPAASAKTPTAPQKTESAGSERKTYLRKSSAYHRETHEPADNWGAVPHVFWSLLGREIFSGGSQMSVLGYILSRTWGNELKLPWAKIPVTDVTRETRLSKNMVQLALEDALKRGLIAARKVGAGCGDADVYEDGRKPSDWDTKTGSAIYYQLRPQNWESAPKYVPPPVAGETEESPDDEDAEAEPEEQKRAAAVFTMTAGKSSMVHLRIPVEGIAEGIDVKLNCHNETGSTFAVDTATTRGCVHLTFREKVAKGERTANNLPNALGSFRNREWHPYLSELVSSQWAKPLDEPFFQRIMTAAGDDCPLAYFSDLAAVDLAAARAKRKVHPSDILVAYARQARKRFEDDQRAQAAKPAAPSAESLFSVPDLQRMAASSDVIERDHALELLRERGIETGSRA